MEHVPVLLAEVLEGLAPKPGQTIVDGTLGGGGHTRAISAIVGDEGTVIALDRDPAALVAAERTLAGQPIKLAHSNFSELPEVLREIGVQHVDGILLDLGLSSDQLADESRGFSFQSPGPLDLRFDSTHGESAARLVNRLSEQQLADLIYEYGEERYSRRIARAIGERRREREIVSAADLAEIVRRAIPRSRHEQRIDPATRTFQALRIAVNDELRSLESALARLPDCLRHGGRLAIISFHSLEDRRVKEAFRDDPRLTNLSRKPTRPSEAELAANPRGRSAKLRVAQRV
jgi:16S rRNA (cytosine1402-N4)-methyltransferase